MDIEISLQSIKKGFGTKVLFSNLSWRLQNGKCYCVCGDNGAGKSTMLKCIGQQVRVDSGSVEARCVGRLYKRDKFKQLCGMVAPDFILYDDLSAKENIEFFAGLGNSQLTAEIVEAALARTGILAVENQQVSGFSTGMKQRLKLAVLLASDKPIWILDEPSSNLDAKGCELVKTLIEQALAEDRLVIMATNDWSEREYAAECLDVAEYQNHAEKGTCG